jgi:type IV pilus assembly protein PilE
MKNKGLTLIELLITVAIVAILAGVGVPIYNGYLERARRSDAKVALEQLRAGQEMRRAERGGYSMNLVELQNTWGIPRNPIGDYNLILVNTGVNQFRAEAQPFTARQVGDGSLFINQNGEKTPAAKWAK